MGTTTLLSGLELTKWQSKMVREYVRDSGFAPYMGDSTEDIIQVKNELKDAGYTIRIPLLARLQGNGVSGNTLLTGNEEQQDMYYQDITWEFYRNAVLTTKKEREKSAVDFFEEARPQLRSWASELIKYQLIDSFHKMSGGLKFTASDATARNLWAVNNQDRVLYGSTQANYSGVHATDVNKVDNTDDKLTPAVGSLAKFMARQASPHIRPFKTGTQGREFYVMFCHPLCFRDLKRDSTMTAANRDARPRDVDANPLFQDGDLVYDGVIYREIPEFYQPRQGSTANPETTISSSVVVGANFLCGAQALGFVNKQAPLPTSKADDDYGFLKGVGIELAHGIDKLRWNNGSGLNKDHGMVTVYAAAVA
jgi:N4-gp56 family major capsid protein